MDIVDELRDAATQEFLQQQEEKFEARSVKLVLKLLGLERHYRQWRPAEYDYRYRYTFDEFFECYPDFPLAIRVSRQRMYRLAEDEALQPSKFFRRFGKGRLLAEYETTRDDLSQVVGVPVALLVPLAGYQDGVAMHDAPAPIATGAMWAYRCPDGRLYWVELFREVVKAIGRTWTAFD